MPENPPNDDQFADLFSTLPGPGAHAPRSASTATADVVPDDDAPATAPASSRRAAREAARRTPTGPTAAVPAAPAPAEPNAVSSPDQPPPASGHASVDALFGGRDDPEHERAARHHRDRRKSRIAGWVIFAVILALLGGVAAGGFYVWNTYEDKIRAFMGWEEPKDYEEGLAHGDATITIADGDTWSTISQTMYEAGVTKTPQALYDYLISTGQEPTAQPGVYSLQKQMTSAAALEALEDPANKLEKTAQWPEGDTVEDILPRLATATGVSLADLQAAVKDPSVYGVPVDPAVMKAGGEPLEGWLFPATYTFDPGLTAQQVIQTLVDRTVASLDDAQVPEDERQEIVTIASIIQREARSEDDFYKVSRVIQNRLDPGNDDTFGKLQMDSTAQYGYGEMHDGTVSSSQAALEDDNPWNTYVVTGLPVGPISNPGDVAIDAAMHPADGDWMYFVTVNLDTGETVFSDTYAEHEKAVAQWRDWCSANDSPDC